MKKTLLSLSILSLGIISYAQVGVGTNDPKATLDVVGKPTDTNTPDGVIAPRIKRTELIAKNTIYTTAQTGAIVYITDVTGTADSAGGKAVDVTAIGYYYFDGTKWVKFTQASAVQDLRFVGANNHVTQDAGVGSNGTSAGTGSNNIAIGAGSLNAIATGSNIIAIGQNALSKLTNPSANDAIAIGVGALGAITTQSGNTAIGSGALTFATSNFNTAVGVSALGNVKGDGLNTALGNTALLSLGQGTNNTSVGYRTGAQMAVGYDNTFLGGNTAVYLKGASAQHNTNTFVGANITTTDNTSPSVNINYGKTVALGNNALNGLGNTITNITNGLFLGNDTSIDPSLVGVVDQATAIGAGAKVGASNSIVLGRPPVSGVAIDKVGIGNITPQSTLTVEGSLETGYKEVTAATTLSANDYYVTYSGATAATITMPIVGSATTSFTGRIYKIKNVSNNTVTVAGAGTDTFRNSGAAIATLILAPGQYVEVVNNGNATGGATWDVSSINVATPPVNNWQFDNIYDYTAANFQDITTTATDLTGFTQAITIPANKAAKIVVSYSIPLGASSNSLALNIGNVYPTPNNVAQVQANLAATTLTNTGGYYGVIMQRNGLEFSAGSRKSTVMPKNANTTHAMTTVSATVADNIVATGSAQTITYKLQSYLENVPGTVKYLMYEGTGGDPKNYNWGKGYWSITVYLK